MYIQQNIDERKSQLIWFTKIFSQNNLKVSYEKGVTMESDSKQRIMSLQNRMEPDGIRFDRDKTNH